MVHRNVLLLLSKLQPQSDGGPGSTDQEEQAGSCPSFPKNLSNSTACLPALKGKTALIRQPTTAHCPDWPAWFLRDPFLAQGSVWCLQWENVVQGEDGINQSVPRKRSEGASGVLCAFYRRKTRMAAASCSPGAGVRPGAVNPGRPAVPFGKTRGRRPN